MDSERQINLAMSQINAFESRLQRMIDSLKQYEINDLRNDIFRLEDQVRSLESKIADLEYELQTIGR